MTVIAVLDPAGGWRPDPVRGLDRVYARDRAGASGRRRRWTWALTTASAACIMLLAVSGAASVRVGRPPETGRDDERERDCAR